jgi:hypothetical protein
MLSVEIWEVHIPAPTFTQEDGSLRGMTVTFRAMDGI